MTSIVYGNCGSGSEKSNENVSREIKKVLIKDKGQMCSVQFTIFSFGWFFPRTRDLVKLKQKQHAACMNKIM